MGKRKAWRLSTPEQRDKAICLYWSGMTLREAGDSVGFSHESVRNWLHKAGGNARPWGWKPPKPGEEGA